MRKSLIISHKQIENRIFTIRDVQVMIDHDLAELYNVETKRLNEQVKRNKKRFPEKFMFQLSEYEWKFLQSQIATSEKEKNLQSQNATSKRRTLPYVFTEQGVAMLSAVLNSETAISVSIQIIDAFVKLRHIIYENSLINHRLEKLEINKIESDQKFNKIFTALECKSKIPDQGVFFEGKIFDAYEFASKIIRKAENSIVLIDNYIDENTLVLLSKKNKGVEVKILTKKINETLKLDVQKANEQYENFELIKFNKSHDRFLMIDNKEIYHIGASLKDLGKKWFAFSKMDKISLESLFKEINKLI